MITVIINHLIITLLLLYHHPLITPLTLLTMIAMIMIIMIIITPTIHHFHIPLILKQRVQRHKTPSSPHRRLLERVIRIFPRFSHQQRFAP